MANLKRHFISGKMNKSVDERLVPNGEYIDALNVRLGSTEASEIGSVENSKGNTQVTTLEYNGTALSNSAKCIGVLDDSANETLYWLVHDPSFSATTPKKLDLIVSIDLKTDALVYHVISVRNGTTTDTTLNFNPTYLVTGIDLVEDQLFFTDDFNPPRVINVKRNYANPVANVDQFTAEELLVIKKPPVEAPTFTLDLTPGDEDYLEERFICFGYRYRYADNQYSATSQFSEPAFAPKPFDLSSESYLNEGMVNSKNQAIITYNSGGPLVVGVDLLFKESGNSIIKVIQKLDKQEEGLADNTDYTFAFNSNKIFTVLPDSQLLRLFDNVPRFAQAQTIMGNRLVYGNYVDGYDLKDKNGSPTRLEYQTELSSSEISIDTLSTNLASASFELDLSPAEVIDDSKLEIDFAGVELNAGSEIFIEFSIKHSKFTNKTPPSDVPNEDSGEFFVAFSYVLPQNFATINDLATSADFINRVGTSLPSGNIKPVYDATNPTSCSGTTFTDNFNCAIPNVLDAASSTTWTKFASGRTAVGQSMLIGSSAASNQLDITILAVERKTDVLNPTDPATKTAYEYFKIEGASATIASSPSALSLHSNRNYEVGIIYMDEFNRSTTALVSEFNSVNIPCGDSVFKNIIKVKIPPQQLAPSFATRYKFCIKPDREGYDTIYSNIYFVDSLTSNTFFLIEGENAQKVEEGTRLIVKADANGPLSSCRYATVLEKKSYGEDFITSVPPVTVPAGTYMKILANDFAADIGPSSVVSPGRESREENNIGDVPLISYFGLNGDIPRNSRIRVSIKANRRGGLITVVGTVPEASFSLEGEFISPNNYNNIIDWFNDNNIETVFNNLAVGSENNIPFTGFSRMPDLGPPSSPPWSLIGQVSYRWAIPDASSPNNCVFAMNGWISYGPSNKRRSTMSVRWEIIKADNTIVFETEPSDALPDVWFEGADSYAIDQATGFHSGSPAAGGGQDQNATQDAIVITDFGNCYAYGNGVESYRIRDSIKGNAFSLGERAFSTSAEDYQEADRFAALTYSGVFNTETNVNNLNEFNLGLLNFKNLEEVFGPIQIISGRETDILTLQEDKISYVLAGKNLLSDAAGGSAITSVPEVLGTQIARVEEYGISQNPESFVQYGFNKFFTDSKRGALLQLRGSGQAEQLSVISEIGMRSWFRDLFIGSGNTQKLGAFDPYMNEFVLSSNETELPVEPIVYNCGVTRTVFVSASSPITFDVNFGENAGNVDVSFNVISVSDSSGGGIGDGVRVTQSYNSPSTSVTKTGTGNATLSFTKATVLPTNGTISIQAVPTVPGGKATATVEITVGCPAGDKLTLVNVSLTNPADAGNFVHNQYRWVDGTYTSPLHSTQIGFPSLPTGSTAPWLLGYSQISDFQGGGTIPTDGATLSVIMNKIAPSDTYNFKPSNRLMFLRSSTPYTSSPTDIALLLLEAASPTPPNAGGNITPSPITNTALVEGQISVPSGNDGDYLYIIYDYYT